MAIEAFAKNWDDKYVVSASNFRQSMEAMLAIWPGYEYIWDQNVQIAEFMLYHELLHIFDAITNEDFDSWTRIKKENSVIPRVNKLRKLFKYAPRRLIQP